MLLIPGKVHPWCHVANLQPAGFLYAPDLLSEKTAFFLRSMDLTFKPDYHPTSFVSRPVQYESRIANLGNTSLHLAIDLRDLNDPTLYMTSLVHIVMIERKTARPCPIPTAFVEKFRHRVSADTPTTRQRFEPRPEEGVATSRRLVQYSDLDVNEHLSYSSYLRVLMDAGGSAAVDGCLTSFTRELEFYNIKNLSIDLQRSVTVGNEIDILCWENADIPYTLHFEIMHENRATCRSKISFYPENASKN